MRRLTGGPLLGVLLLAACGFERAPRATDDVAVTGLEGDASATAAVEAGSGRDSGEPAECTAGDEVDCEAGAGCAPGKRTCDDDGRLGPCLARGATSEDACDDRDDDCDGSIDEGCDCEAGARQPCYDGPAATQGVGVCQRGNQSCEDGLWGECRDATGPTRDLCNGKDDDCDGETDEDDPAAGRICETGASGPCGGGVSLCRNGSLTCVGANPAKETCNGQDDDCDSRVDEDFREPTSGLYATDQHCGECGMACGGTIEGAASERCAIRSDGARCEVEQCKAGYVQSDPLSCMPAMATPCASCKVDADCPTPGDKCLELLYGERGCGVDCSIANAHGEAPGTCPEGFVCTPFGDTVSQCVPTTGSCSCLPKDAGKLRDCALTNQFGTCQGNQTCAALTGWSPCNAPVPLAETCNGADDDCDGNADEENPGGGAPCATGQLGACATGRLTCVSAELVCKAPAPAPTDVCGNHIDDDCNGSWDDNCCGHSECQAGAALALTCSQCAACVCSLDANCCGNAWNATCAELAAGQCAKACPCN